MNLEVHPVSENVMHWPLLQGSVERLKRRREVEGTGGWVAEVSQLVADTSVDSVHSP